MKRISVVRSALLLIPLSLCLVRPTDALGQGTVVTSSETVRAALTGDTAIVRPIVTRYSGFFGSYYLDDLAGPAPLRLYDATGYADPAPAAAWYSTCTEPACYTFSQGSDAWLTGDAAYHASDFRNAQKILGLFASLYGRNGADGHGENLNVLSGLNDSDAIAMATLRCISLGRPDYARMRPSFGTIGIMGHKFSHLVSFHQWVGSAGIDYGTEGSLHGVAGTVDEHLADLFGVIASYSSADESWVANARWGVDAELEYGANYPHRDETDFYRTMTISRNPYLGTDAGTPRAHVSQLYTGSNDNGGVNRNAVLLDRAAYLYTEGGYAGRAPDSIPLTSWPHSAPDFEVQAIGMDRLCKLAYYVLTTPAFDTPLGTLGLADLNQVEQDSAGMKAELTRFAHIVLAASESLSIAEEWPSWISISVRNGFAAVGLLDADRDYDGWPDSLDNCADVYDPDQTDANQNGIGDVCEGLDVEQGRDGRPLPTTARLFQNYPNPFNPSTAIRYELPGSSAVRLSVHDVLGREVRVLVNGRMEAGYHEVELNAAGLPSGVYFYRFTAYKYSATKKILLLR